MYLSIFFFFFQAEDGIRDYKVTGVQTCALPISRHALGVAQEYDVLVTVGVTPTRNETGYGYIVPGKPLGGGRAVRRFVEKPSAARAALLRRRGALWNTDRKSVV